MGSSPTQTPKPAGAETGAGEAPPTNGVLPFQALVDAVRRGWIRSGEYRVTRDAYQPASLDLRLGDFAWGLRCSFLPDEGSTVDEKVQDVQFQRIDLRDGATLERDRPYLIPLVEELALPEDVQGKANPKSSTGRLDVFTRVITDSNHRFDEIRPGYRGKLYLEVVPRSFAVKVKTGLRLNQVRLVKGQARVDDKALWDKHAEEPLLFRDGQPVPASAPASGMPGGAGGVLFSLDLAGPADRIVGYRAKKNSLPIDLASPPGTYDWRDFWDPVFPEKGSKIVLEPEVFYLLLSAEGVCIPPDLAGEMLAYDPTAGELRTHYAGFFDPGFGYSADIAQRGSRAALEVRARDVAFMIEHEQPVGKLAFEWMSERPKVLYGEDLASNYQGQETMLSKHFAEQRAGTLQLTLNGAAAAASTADAA